MQYAIETSGLDLFAKVNEPHRAIDRRVIEESELLLIASI
ncbi:hypothetical protein GLE_0011 [Lysobacter enzymogenes]|uniref:Uncharacterized protein n=1 Tax=Lysobacter enzymogenes TaxID=69 RepID=A0A0S2D9Y3_LYSEN|nr:hypothetical protein GLE_0011 [Lysobacter enzymogenes]